MGAGYSPWEVVQETVREASLSGTAQQKLLGDLDQLADRRSDGRRALTYAAFLTYYQGISQGVTSDGDFEQLLHSQWGLNDVSDILTSMQRQFALIGLSQVFQEHPPGELSSAKFESALRRAGLQPRRDDLHRLYRAFGGREGTVRLDDFKDQILAPHPETPPPSMHRDLDMSELPQPTAKPAAAMLPPPATAAMPAPVGGAGSAINHLPLITNQPIIATPMTAVGAQPHGIAPSAQHGVAAARHPAQGGGAAGATTGQDQVGDEDLDAMLSKMESHLHHLKTKKATGNAPGGATASAPPLPPPGQQLAAGQAAAHGHGHLVHHQPPEGPVSDADLDATLSRMQNHLNHIKAHKHSPDAKPHWDKSSENVPDPPDMPHWEHHKYGHHKVTAPAWKPGDTVTDMYGHQHAASEYGYSNYGAGAHGHHLSHYHLNDYHGLAHHSFQQQEYHKKQFGDAAHHGHWVPHLHGIGTEGHHGEHSYKQEEFGNQSYGKQGHHSHWVPHLHGLGQAHPKDGSSQP